MESACGGRNVAGGTWRAADGVRHPFGVPRLRWFRVTGVALSLHRLPVVHRSYGASISQWHAVLQGLRYRSTACLWSIAPTKLPFRVVCAGYMYRGCAIAPPPACGLPPLRGLPGPTRE